MFQSGEYVVYGVHGVCCVKGCEKQTVNRKRVEYLVLEPVGNGESRYYVPTASEAAMGKLKPVLSPEELTVLLTSDEIRQGEWIAEDNQRKQYYRELIGSGDRVSILKMVCALYRYKEEQTAAGRKFHLADDNFLRDAEKFLSSEISLVLEKTPEEARHYLREQLK